VLSGFGGFDRLRFVKKNRRRDINRFNFRVGNQRFPIGKPFFRAEFYGKFFREFRPRAAYRDKITTRCIPQGGRDPLS
jgi:hypothetical protein